MSWWLAFQIVEAGFAAIGFLVFVVLAYCWFIELVQPVTELEL